MNTTWYFLPLPLMWLLRLASSALHTALLSKAMSALRTGFNAHRYPLIFLAVFVPLCLCDASKKQAKERALDMEAATEKVIFFEEATGI